ncbi:casein kinase II beta subunit [Gonapodya prolifera JEL478]|uniref:Casein kinase II subunit beta n=1 Tax=Gonapodya prolifera (strain JEL478) TaxID=1344416 RepID=A0A139AGU3_GONPJ|nr:casein kinase II beta subunit [Gonapodya prolifera JEL478]|eukprot:KXS16031.1 casein kinase II beta subunit [Gonapodya prolifera JEL478]
MPSRPATAGDLPTPLSNPPDDDQGSEQDEEEEARNDDGDGEQDEGEDVEEEDVEEEEEVQEDDQEEFSTDSYISSGTTGSSSAVSWIGWFCGLPGHDFFTEVPEEFIEDDFNLCGLNAIVPHYNEALDTILDLDVDEGSGDAADTRPPTPPTLSDPSGRAVSLSPAPHPTNVPTTYRSRPTPADIGTSAALLYRLVHARYLSTKGGLAAMAERFAQGDFGTCPRVMCRGQYVVPVGRFEQPGREGVRTWCPRCGDVYIPRDRRIQETDGASFGPTFPHLLFLTYPELCPAESLVMPESALRASPALQPASTSLRPGVGVGAGGQGGRENTMYGAGVFRGGQASDSESVDEEGAASGGQRRRGGGGGPPQGGAAAGGGQVEPQVYTPKVFGFRVSERARTGPRMAWLRAKGDESGGNGGGGAQEGTGIVGVMVEGNGRVQQAQWRRGVGAGMVRDVE